ncbi:hypothetical protein LTR05_007399 [Lithohypha guttulata]|uniref:Uncharacterized protein n=1 Tax=Lithohypha guttulata TaxID=1690604 RepID=A0AAN7Y937_9EURO|nr:hypothetical protein LTR05_007399 [Lithohypha guttulata]
MNERGQATSFDQPFEPGHSDRLTVLELNNDGTKLLTASVDHRIAVYEIDRATSKRKQLDVWTAHDAEIKDAKWFHTSVGTYFVTIANDLQMRIWTQDVYQAPMSGRRFKRIAALKSEQLVPFSGIDVKTVGNNTYIVVTDRQGLLTLYEPTNPDEFNEWTVVDQFYVYTPTPSRADHTSFRVQFDPNPLPLPYQLSLDDDQDQISIAVTAMNDLKIYRSSTDIHAINTIKTSQQSHNVGRGASYRIALFEVLKLSPTKTQTQTSAGTLLRDLAWCAGNFRGTDNVAVACINGTITVYEVAVRSKELRHTQDAPIATSKQYPRPALQSHQSNLTSALHPTTTSPDSTQKAHSREGHPFLYSHSVVPLTVLVHAHADAWSLRWDPSGQTLLSGGSDGIVKMWKRDLTGSGLETFELFAEQAGEDTSDQDSMIRKGSFEINAIIVPYGTSKIAIIYGVTFTSLASNRDFTGASDAVSSYGRAFSVLQDAQGDSELHRVCEERNLVCVPQTRTSVSTVASKQSSGDRLTHLEAELLHIKRALRTVEAKLNINHSSFLEHTPQPPSSAGTLQEPSGIDTSEDDDTSEKDEILIDDSNSRMRNLFQNEWLSTDDPYATHLTRTKAKKSGDYLLVKARTALQTLIPSIEDVRILADHVTVWSEIAREMFPPLSENLVPIAQSKQQIMSQYTQIRQPDADTWMLAQWLLALAMTAQQMPHEEEQSTELIKTVERRYAFAEMLTNAVEQTLLSHESLLGTPRGLETAMQFLRL